MKQLFTIQNWNVWPPLGKEVDDALLQKQLLLTLPRMLRRRLTPLARAVFSAAIPCVDKNSAIPIVFSSTHGELAKSFKMMEMLEAGEEISPTALEPHEINWVWVKGHSGDEGNDKADMLANKGVPV